MGTVTVKTVNPYDYPITGMPKIIANRREQDCSENRLLDYLSIYLNKIKYSKDDRVWFGNAENLILYKGAWGLPYYRANIKKSVKSKNWVTTENMYLDIPLKIGDLFIRAFKIKEFTNKIKTKN